MRRVLFVCTANICRSPSAKGVLRRMLAQQPGTPGIEVDAAGTHDMRAGLPPFPMAVEAAKRRGYDVTQHLARMVNGDDFDRFDLILAMDRSHLAHLRTIAPTRCKDKIELFLEYGDEFHGDDVPDPYGGEAPAYEAALDRIEDGCRGLAQLLARKP